MKKTAAAAAALILLMALVFTGCKGTEGGKVTENSGGNIAVSSTVRDETRRRTESTTNSAAESIISEAATRIEEFGSDAESRAEGMLTDAQSVVSDLFNNTDESRSQS